MGVSEKRLISIMPSYLLVCFIWPFAYPDSIKDWVLLLPVDLLGVQTAYRTLFGILHNGGAWFVSCMLMCYVAYPVIKSILGSLKKYVPLVIVIVLYTLLVYNNIVIPKYALDSTYSNPIIRTAEFMIGVAFAEIVFRERQNADRAFMKNLGGGGWKPLWVILFLVVLSVFSGTIVFMEDNGGSIGGVRYQWKYGKNFCFINMLYFYIVYCMVLL